MLSVRIILLMKINDLFSGDAVDKTGTYNFGLFSSLVTGDA